MARLRIALIEPNLTCRYDITGVLHARNIDAYCTSISAVVTGLFDESVDAFLAAWSVTESLEVVNVVRALRTPIVLYTSTPCSPTDRARALDAGADDIVADVLGAIDELVARLHALQRRSSGTYPKSLTFGAIELDVATRVVRVAGCDVDLTRNEFTLLSLLAARSPRPVTRAELFSALGYREDAQSHAVKQTILRLRAKLGLASSQVKAITGIGYRLESA